ncbi:hypothetical protein EE612_022284, partial [Oryza sativa]
ENAAGELGRHGIRVNCVSPPRSPRRWLGLPWVWTWTTRPLRRSWRSRRT